ncbi:hypothetical protein FJ364_03560 [Candidatus Dependentiae bacterium]|nr:hypothetical protein [Candidatus Dependentiae bacterium]
MINVHIKKPLVEGLKYIHQLDRAMFNKYTAIGLGVMSLIIGSGIYFIYHSCSYYEKEIVKLQNMKKKTRKLLLDFNHIDAEEAQVKSMLNQHKNFDLKIYFELFCKEQGFTPSPDWNTSITPFNPQVDEIVLTATFKGLVTENLVRMLQGFDKTPVVYLKNMRIKTEKDKKITCEITLATIQTKTQG